MEASSAVPDAGTIPCGDGSGRQPAARDRSAEPGGSEEHSKRAPSGCGETAHVLRE